MEFKSIDAALKYIKKQIDAALGDEVLDAVRATEQAAVWDGVYTKYGMIGTGEPKEYERGYGRWGISSMGNMSATVGSNTLVVTNETPYASNVIAGGPYDYPYKPRESFGNFRQPRDFISGTAALLKAGEYHVDALRDGLSARGINIK